ncbi:MAG: ABC transporter substrate-binding protein [Pseudomonadota bacterium]
MGFELLKIPVGVKEMQDQSSQWLEIRKERPDWVIMWSWGVMTTVAIKQAANTRFPMDRFIGNVWAAENAQVAAAGPGAKGVKTANFHGTGSNYPALKDMVRLVLNRGKSRAGAATVGTAFYNRGVFNAVIVAEAIRTAQNLTGRAAITGRDMRKGLEQLNLSAERLKELGLEGFMEPIRGSCRDHSGSGSIFIQQWNGSSWERVSENIAPDVYRVRPKLKAAARAYVSDRTGWPTQVCP